MLIIRSIDEFDENGTPLFWHNDNGWVPIEDAQTFEREAADNFDLPVVVDEIDGKMTPRPAAVWQKNHRSHTLTYNEVCTAVYEVLAITHDGDLSLQDEAPEIEAITDTFLYCETCMERIMGLEIGANDEWSVV
jgi:hypothetical protein